APGKAQQIWRQEMSSGRIEIAISQVYEARLGADLLADEADAVQGHRTALGRAPGAVATCADHIARAIGDQTDATQGSVLAKWAVWLLFVTCSASPTSPKTFSTV